MCKENCNGDRELATAASSVGPDDVAAPARGNDGPLRLDPTAQALIGQQLKAFYGRIVQEEVPKHLLDLLEELERREQLGEKPK